MVDATQPSNPCRTRACVKEEARHKSCLLSDTGECMCQLIEAMLSMQWQHCPSEINTLVDTIKQRSTTQLPEVARNNQNQNQMDELLLLSRKEVDELYDLLEVLVAVLTELKIEYTVIAGSLLGAVRSESILFNAHDIRIAVIDDGSGSYNKLKLALPNALAKEAQKRSAAGAGKKRILYQYQEACDRIRSTAEPRVWVDIFVLKRYETLQDLARMVQGAGNLQAKAYLNKIRASIPESAFPLHHYDNRKAIEQCPRQYFTQSELRPLGSLSFGPLKVAGPNDSIGTLKRFFGEDCFTHYTMHTTIAQQPTTGQRHHARWEGSRQPLLDMHYHPLQHSRRDSWSGHSRKALESTISLYEEDREPVTISPSSTGALSRSRSLFTIGNPSPSQSLSTRQSQPSTNSMHTGPATEPRPSKWFGHDVRQHIGETPEAPVFDKELRAIMEPYIANARRKREEARNPATMAFDPSIASNVGVPYRTLRGERRFLFDPHSHPIHQVLAETLGVDDLSQLHNHPIKDKKELLAPLLTREGRRRFHECYDHFVTSFCIPLLHSLAMTNNEFHSTSPTAASEITYRYQAFPCLRVVRPGELPIDPHSDAAYGHSIGNLNFHIPLTPVFGTNALYTESHPGREDWHGLTTKSPGLGFLFDGSRCLHFTLENTTNVTRVSIDFRIAIYRNGDPDGGLCSKELLVDRFSNAGPGYYDEAAIAIGVGSSSFPGAMLANKAGKHLLHPDARVGFPFTN